MPPAICPVCPNCASTDTAYLEATSQDAFVHYCRCHACGHVWTVSKDGKDTVTDVTERTPSGGTPFAKPGSE